MSAEDTRPGIPAPLPDHARRAAEAAYRGWRIGDDGEGRLHAALVAAVPLIRAEYENAIGWNTSCLSCARVLDSAYAETVRREQAEAKLAAIEAMCKEGAPAVAVDRIEAILGTQERSDEEAAERDQLRAALKRHTHHFTDHAGVDLCGGCLRPSPCPDAALCGGERP